MAHFAAHSRGMPNASAYLTKPGEVEENFALLKTDAAAAALGVSRRTVQELVEQRKLAAIKFGRNVRFAPADIRAFVDKHRNKAAGWASRTEGTPAANQ
jgi:excisionase family DNA binding protein